jgi:hypothetical protein
MRPKIAAICLSGLLVGPTVAPLFAQSLADVARREEERRKTIKEPAKVISNKDLTAARAPSSPPAVPASASTPKDTKDAKDAKDAKDTKEAKDAAGKDGEPVKDQAYWSGRLKALQGQLDRDQVYADALQTRINALTTDFVNRDDPGQRNVIANDKQKALDESNRLKQQIQNDKKAIADLQEEARRAGVPPGWLR